MKKAIPVFLFLFSILSCSQGKVVVLVDNWWEAAYEDSANLRRQTILSGIKGLQTVSIFRAGSEQEGYQILAELLEKYNELTVVLSPAFASYLKQWDFGEKNINYILLNGFYDDPADNVIAVYSSRDEVYRTAGIKAAKYSESNDDCAVAAVFYTGTEKSRKERDSFIQGFNEAEVEGELLISDQQIYSGGDKLKSYINTASDDGAGLFFFSASSLNPFCLEQALTLSIPISGENLNSLGMHNELIEFSIDDDMMEIVKTALKLGLDGEVENDFPVYPLIREKGIHF